MSERILIAGIGNIFHGDDAFGVELVHRLLRRSWEEPIVVKDFGIRSFDLAYALLEDWRAVILLDAMPRGDSAGTLYVVEIDPNATATTLETPDAHAMNPLHVLNLARQFGRIGPKIYIVGCEPEDLGSELEGRMGLTDVVAAALPEAEAMVDRLVERLLLKPADTRIPETCMR